jgi:CTP:molybdopterin cytidylyltransferase MocA
MLRPLDLAIRKLDAVVLAAGGSTRLGRPKQLLSYRGAPLILRTIRLARHAVSGRVIVVLGNEQQRLRSLLHRRTDQAIVVNNSNWHRGLATSLQAGLNRTSPTASGILILLVDQAKLKAGDIDLLLARWRKRPARPAAAFYLGGAGAPAVIPRSLFNEIRSLDGDIGARHLLRRLGDVSTVAMPAAEFDVDTPADAAALNS